MQRRIGLTGGIASGKSSVGRLLEARGWPVLDADRYARDALAANSSGAVISAPFAMWRDTAAPVVGEACSTGGPEPRRAGTHRVQRSSRTPLARAARASTGAPTLRAGFLARLRAEPVVVLMIPLLYEAGLDTLCQKEVWLVDCDRQQLIASPTAAAYCHRSPEHKLPAEASLGPGSTRSGP